MDHDHVEPAADPQASLLRAHIEAGKARMLDGGNKPQDSFLFLSSPHEAMPKLAFMDPVLNPVEKTVWANIWIYAKEQGTQGAGFPSHKTLMSRCNIRQRRVVIRSITMLRLCRWVTLCEQVRDSTGAIRGNIYALHDEPAPLALTQQLDPAYMAFLAHCAQHHDQRVRRTAAGILDLIDQELYQGRDVLNHDPLHQHEVRIAAVNVILARERGELPSKLHATGTQASFFGNPVGPLVENADAGDDAIAEQSELSQDDANHRVQNLHTVVSPPENQKSPGAKTAHGNLTRNHQVQNSAHGDFRRSSSSSSIFLKKTTTTNIGGYNHQAESEKPVTAQQSGPTLIRPKELSDNEYALALRRLQKMPLEEQQNLLDELGEQIRQRKDTSNPIRNPIGYLNWLCQQMERGKQPLSSAHLNRQERRKREAALQARERLQAQKAEEELARLTRKLAQRTKS